MGDAAGGKYTILLVDRRMVSKAIQFKAKMRAKESKKSRLEEKYLNDREWSSEKLRRNMEADEMVREKLRQKRKDLQKAERKKIRESKYLKELKKITTREERGR